MTEVLCYSGAVPRAAHCVWHMCSLLPPSAKRFTAQSVINVYFVILSLLASYFPVRNAFCQPGCQLPLSYSEEHVLFEMSVITKKERASLIILNTSRQSQIQFFKEIGKNLKTKVERRSCRFSPDQKSSEVFTFVSLCGIDTEQFLLNKPSIFDN